MKMTKKDREEQKALMNEWMESVKSVAGDDEELLDSERKNIAWLIKLDNGKVTTINKPIMCTCFALGTDGDYETAKARSEKILCDGGDSFIKENMNRINERISALENKDNRWFSYRLFDESACNACEVSYVGGWDDPNMDGNVVETENITEDDRSRLLKGWEVVGEKFEQRLKSYLSRYGTTKLTTLVYRADI